MSIKIDEISVFEAGPVKLFNKKIKPLTVVYGKNESGKTTIVENIVASLFKGNSRRFEGSSKIVVSGFDDGTKEFSPDSEKLDSLMMEQKEGLPKRLFKLLYVKGAEVELTDTNCIDRTFLKDLVSEQKVYRDIEDKLENIKEIQHSTTYIDNDGHIVGTRRTKYYKVFEDASHASVALRDLDEEFRQDKTKIELVRLNKKKTELEQEKSEQEKAKRYYACSLNQQIKELNNQLSDVDENSVRDLQSKIQEYKLKESEYQEKKLSFGKHKNVKQNLIWLQEAKAEYMKCLNASPKFLKWIMYAVLILLAGVLTISLPIFTIIPLWLKITLPSLAFLGLMVYIIVSQISENKSGISRSAGIKAILLIKSEYRDIFGADMKSPADFNTQQKLLEQDEIRVEAIVGQISNLESSLAQLKIQINNLFGQLNKADVSQSEWQKISQSIATEINRLKDRRSRLEGEFNMLEVDRGDFLETPADLDFSNSRYTAIRDEIQNIDNEIKQTENQLFALKEKLAEHIDSTANLNAESIANKINEKQQGYTDTIKSNLATIIASIALKKVIASLQVSEDEEIEAFVNNPDISKLLYGLTNRYNKIKLDGEDVIIVSNKGKHFNINTLSTGAQEQVLLALRMGIAKKLMGKDSLFIILDDAFQYSDWDRRANLVEQTTALVKEGWQVLYFTMDDNIKARFEDAGKGDKDFKLIELPQK